MPQESQDARSLVIGMSTNSDAMQKQQPVLFEGYPDLSGMEGSGSPIGANNPTMFRTIPAPPPYRSTPGDALLPVQSQPGCLSFAEMGQATALHSYPPLLSSSNPRTQGTTTKEADKSQEGCTFDCGFVLKLSCWNCLTFECGAV